MEFCEWEDDYHMLKRGAVGEKQERMVREGLSYSSRPKSFCCVIGCVVLALMKVRGEDVEIILSQCDGLYMLGPGRGTTRRYGLNCEGVSLCMWVLRHSS